MSISDVAALIGGAALGAPFSEILKLVIQEARKVKDFKPLSQDLASTMERLLPVLTEIDSMQQGLDKSKGELKVLVNTIERAKDMVRKCAQIQWYSISKKASYTREIKGINQEFLKFCQIELQVIQYKNQLKSMRPTASDAKHLVRDFQYEESERQLDNRFALADEEEKQLEERLKFISKRKQFEELVKRVEQIAQDESVLYGEDEQLAKAIMETLKGTRFKDEQLAVTSVIPKIDLLSDTARAFHNEGSDMALAVSRQEAGIQEAEQLASAIQESSRLSQGEEGRRIRELEKDVQIARTLHYEESERQLDNRSVLEEDEQLVKALVESSEVKPKRKQFEEQRKKDEERTGLHEASALEDEKDAQLLKIVKASLMEEDKRKQFKQQFKIVEESLNLVESTPGIEEIENIPTRFPSEEYEQQTISKSKNKQSAEEVEDKGKLTEVNPSMCGGCHFEVELGMCANLLGVLWHLECLWCDACYKKIAMSEAENIVSNSRGNFHISCYGRYCYVCRENKMINYRHHHFWEERYCTAHESDGTTKCWSCERLEPWEKNYVMLGDHRWLCLECMESAVMDTYEGRPLDLEIREFFGSLYMKIQKGIPVLLVEEQALNKAKNVEKIDYQHEVLTGGICLSKRQTVTSVSKGPKIGPKKQLTGMGTESQEVVRQYEVTAILILYGLPRLLTGYILTREMMRAYFRLNGHKDLDKVLEEGICQVLGHMWLDSQRIASIDSEASSSTSASSFSSHISAASCASKKGKKCSDFEKKLVEFYKNQIETDESPVYGVGFRIVNEMVTNTNLEETLKEIIYLS